MDMAVWIGYSDRDICIFICSRAEQSIFNVIQ